MGNLPSMDVASPTKQASLKKRQAHRRQPEAPVPQNAPSHPSTCYPRCDEIEEMTASRSSRLGSVKSNRVMLNRKERSAVSGAASGIAPHRRQLETTTHFRTNLHNRGRNARSFKPKARDGDATHLDCSSMDYRDFETGL